MWPASVPRFLDDFCRNTSLHGWSFCFRPDKPPGHTLFWLVVQAGALTAIVLMLKTSVEDFAGATVSYELESSSVGLDQVAFPNAVICNMNLIRKSYILAVQEELEEVMLMGGVLKVY